MKIVKYLIVFSLLFSFGAYAQNAKRAVLDSGIYLVDYNTKELQETFDEFLYDEYLEPFGNKYPRIFLKTMPSDFAALEDQTYRNQVFIKILMPLILLVNEEVLQERAEILNISEEFKKNKDVTQEQMQRLEELAAKYDVVTPFKDTRRYMKLLADLSEKVDIVPPSILLATAAVYTNWGTSRVAIEANNLYKAKLWYTTQGLKPEGDEKDGYTYKIYDSLEDSIRDYVFKLNSNINYKTFRDARAVSRKRESVLYGRRLDFSMFADSQMPNFAGLVDYILTYYQMSLMDEAVLEASYGSEN